MLADSSECKVVTGVDDHSRFCVMATVVVRATGRAVCLAFAEALRRYGIPDEVCGGLSRGAGGVRPGGAGLGQSGRAGKQFWLGPSRAGVTVTFWADHDVIYLSIAGARVKTIRSHLSTTDLAALAATGGRPAGPSPLPPPHPGAALEVDRTVSQGGLVSLGKHRLLAAEILAGRRISIRLDDTTLMCFDPDTRELLRTRPNPLTYDQARKLGGAHPAGLPPRPSIEPVTVQRRPSATGVILVAGQKLSLGRTHAHTVVTVHVAQHILTVDFPDGAQRTFGRTSTKPVRSWKAHHPRTPHR